MIDVVVDALACVRLTRVVVTDSQDMPLLVPLRERAERALPEAWRPVLECPWCASAYVATGVVVARRLFPRGWDRVARGLAFSAVAGLLSGHEES